MVVRCVNKRAVLALHRLKISAQKLFDLKILTENFLI